MAECRCQSLSVYLERITVLATTKRGTGIFERLFGGVGRDNVALIGIADGVKLIYPPGGRKAWPEGGDWALAATEWRPPDRIRLATVVPFGSGCDVSMNLLVQFYERDWDSLQDLLEEAVSRAADLGMISAPPAYAGFLGRLGDKAIDVFKEVLDLVTSLRSERMGEIAFRLDPHSLDDPAELAAFPWGAELAPARMTDKTANSFKYTTVFEEWDGRWEAVFYVERRCTPTAEKF